MASIAPPSASQADEILTTIRQVVDDGRSLTAVERLLDGLDTDPDHRASLWLYAWAYSARRSPSTP